MGADSCETRAVDEGAADVRQSVTWRKAFRTNMLAQDVGRGGVRAAQSVRCERE